MSRVAGLLAFALAIAPLAGCNRGDIGSGTNYFPLTPNSTWTYQIVAKSQGACAGAKPTTADPHL